MDKILVIEDDDIVRSTLKEILTIKNYAVVEAIDGEIGLQMAVDEFPDLIISDINMPKMDGLNLCLNLRSNDEISHIPLIFLTANKTDKDRLSGLEKGADDYLTKPFNNDELLLKVKNTIESRRRLLKHYRHLLIESSGKIDDGLSEDEEFTQKAYQLVQENLANTNFNVSNLADFMAISERNLYRKIKKLTGITVNEFIREIRLSTAKKLMNNRKYNTIAEIAYAVGFKDPGYFSKVFEDYTGETPSNYMKNN